MILPPLELPSSTMARRGGLMETTSFLFYELLFVYRLISLKTLLDS